ncbi:hypothetical protein QFC20_002692 [Naganishia adeliensis]|uniref:Uncharacterized protein n=1 Tax=Naganishia adeliensis TaxID=92952 RepID=A0ACC2WIH3_9TREE|nr:hypothetical protein QFC20_002692 [Naganishia adeliensis]
MPPSAPSPLRQNVLRNALSLVSQHSFTRTALLTSIRQLPHHDSESLLQSPEVLVESLFGTGIEPEKSLVREWEARGLESMKAAFPRDGEERAVAVTTGKGKGKATQVDFEALKRAMGARIRWSSETAGEHLVQAHSLLATPSQPLSASLPQPLTAIAAALGTRLRLDLPYTPPSEGPTQATLTQQTPTTQSLTLPLVNPLPLLEYAVKIADEALYVSETHLLHPRPPHATSDPQLPAALKQLDASMARYRALSAANGRLAEIEKEVGQFAWFVWKSWGGLFRSRGWIN